MSLLLKLLLCASVPSSLCSILKFHSEDTNRSPEPDSCCFVHQAPLKYIFGYHSQANKIKFYSTKIILFLGHPLHTPLSLRLSVVSEVQDTGFWSSHEVWQLGKYECKHIKEGYTGCRTAI